MYMLNVKQLKMNEFINYIWHLIISTSNATLEAPAFNDVIKTDFLGNGIPKKEIITLA